MAKSKILRGDCRAVMRKLAPNSVDSIVTDPPYHLTAGKKGGSGPASVNLNTPAGRARITAGFMGQAWDGGDVAFQVETWAEALRVLKPGGYLLAFSGSRTYHRMVCAIEDAGFEIRDQIMWLYGSGFPKSHNIGNGLGTALKPAHEPIVVARKPLIGTVAANVQAHGTGALNIDGCRVVASGGLTSGGPCIGESALPMNKNAGRQEARARSQEHALGRWPANVIHDGSDEVLEAFAAFGSKGAAAPVHKRGSDKFRNTFGKFAGNVDEAGSTFHGDTGSAARFFYCAKASKADRDAGLSGPEMAVGIKNASGRGFSERDPYAEVKRRNTHPTVKPTDLMRYLCRLVTPPGGLVLDPFMGSGSTGRGAALEGFRFVGIELSDEYADIAAARIKDAA